MRGLYSMLALASVCYITMFVTVLLAGRWSFLGCFEIAGKAMVMPYLSGCGLALGMVSLITLMVWWLADSFVFKSIGLIACVLLAWGHSAAYISLLTFK